ncbi:MAG TPA: CpaD family pilus assembly lipoprotein [Sphingobium sp.]|nr:CpaD family pilus assembly lipoprotein [Sphingobium sp.]
MTRFLQRPAALALGLCLAFSLGTPPGSARTVERGVEPRHQPVVQRTDFVFDVIADGNGGLTGPEESRLTAWFSALGLRYGDRVSLAGTGSLALRDAIANAVGRYGLLVEGEAPITAGQAAGGGLRVVVSRSVASVPGCPSWADRSGANFAGGLSDNYGCAMASNLAAMVADPRDLIEGRDAGVNPTSTVSGRAIKAYQEKAPTGSGGLQSMSTGGK